MCGIAGLLTTSHRSGAFLRETARAMGDTLQHRGPDGRGEWIDEEAGIGLSHRRLAILDLTPAGHQPMRSAIGRYVVVFNGEIYNHLELRRELEASRVNPQWRGHSDTETLLAAVEAWGLEAALRRLAGMFAMAIWDRKARELVLVRDRLGEKPLYYGWQSGDFIFGSELNALRRHPTFDRRIDRSALKLLLDYGYIPHPHSIFEGVFKLPPGHLVKVPAGARHAEPQAYWTMPTNAPLHDDARDEERLATFEEALVRSVRGMMVADVPVGALLSGGLDSSLVTAVMQENANRSVRTYTIGFDETQFDEAPYAEAIARHLGTDHTTLRVGAREALSVVESLPQAYDEPFADASQIPTLLVMRLARGDVTVALSGDGADELLGGYDRYRTIPRQWRQLSRMPAPLRRIAARSARRVLDAAAPDAPVLERVRKIASKVERADSAISLFLDALRLFEAGSNPVIHARDPKFVLSDRTVWPEGLSDQALMMYLDAMCYMPDDVLTKVDRAAMNVSLETRAPYLDHRLWELACGWPVSLKLRHDKSKWPLRQLLSKRMPERLFERPKKGFSVPINEWLRGGLREWASDLLDPSFLRSGAYFDEREITRLWQAHLAGRDAGERLWPVLMFQSWLAAENPIDRKSCAAILEPT